VVLAGIVKATSKQDKPPDCGRPEACVYTAARSPGRLLRQGDPASPVLYDFSTQYLEPTRGRVPCWGCPRAPPGSRKSRSVSSQQEAQATSSTRPRSREGPIRRVSISGPLRLQPVNR